MTISQGLQEDAVVLRFVDYGASDRIVTFFSFAFCELKGTAKGAWRSRKSMSNAL